VRLCHNEYVATNVNLGLACAAKIGHEHIVTLCKSWIAAAT